MSRTPGRLARLAAFAVLIVAVTAGCSADPAPAPAPEQPADAGAPPSESAPASSPFTLPLDSEGDTPCTGQVDLTSTTAWAEVEGALSSSTATFNAYCSHVSRYRESHPDLAWNVQDVANVIYDNGLCAGLEPMSISGLDGGLCMYETDEGATYLMGFVLVGEYAVTLGGEYLDAGKDAISEAIESARISIT